MIDPVLRDEQPNPIRRAAANLHYVHRYVTEVDDHSTDALTITGIMMSLDRCVRSLSKAAHVEDLWLEARGLVKNAETIQQLRKSATGTRHQALIPPMNAAHDALLEAADKLTNTQTIAVPF